MKQRAKHFLIALGVGLLTLFPALPAHAANVFNNNPACKTSSSGASLCGGSGDGLFAVLKSIINIMLIIGGVIAVIMIVIGGIRFATSNGNQAQVKAGRETVLYAVIGLVISVLAYAIVNFVLSNL